MAGSDATKARAVAEAKRVWALYGYSSPDEVILEDLAMAMGILVIEDRLDSCDARLVRKGNRGLIRVRHDIAQEGRKRFAIAHEIGHWRLHASISQLLACTSEDMRADYRNSGPELEANYFASELLMPEGLFKNAMKGKVPEPDVINGLAGEFGTSRTAAAIRFVELSNEYCIMVISERGRIKWWRASSQFDGALWLVAGTVVSERTLAGKLFAGKTLDEEVQSVGMDDWAERHPDYAEEAMEGVIPLGKTGAILTTIWLE